jgi:diacylglycerol diphosphate phosphatase/phosphatidate phosphatase
MIGSLNILLPTTFYLVLSTIYFGFMQNYTNYSYVFRQQFIEQDPDLSKPYISKAQVSNIMLGFLSTLIPFFALIISLIIKSIKPLDQTILFDPNYLDSDGKKILYGLIISGGLGTTLALNSAITNTLKILFGEPRPNFFGLCDYKNYRFVLQTNNYTLYDQMTQFGRFGNPIYCTSSESDIIDGFSSFPSGHSSLMFAGICYASLILCADRKRNIFSYLGSLIICIGMICLGLWVAYTRVADYYHRTYDVMAGIILGCVIGYMTYKLIDDQIKQIFN